MSSVKRQRRVAELLHEEISRAIQFELQDPRIGFVTVTGVEVNSDLTTAVAYVSMLSADKTEENEALAGLESATPFLKRFLAPRLKLRYMPELQFKIDRSLAHSQNIQNILDGIEIPPADDDDLIDIAIDGS